MRRSMLVLLLRVRLVRMLRVRLLLRLVGSTELFVFCLRRCRRRRYGRRGRRVDVLLLVVVHSNAGPGGTATMHTLPGSPP